MEALGIDRDLDFFRELQVLYYENDNNDNNNKKFKFKFLSFTT